MSLPPTFVSASTVGRLRRSSAQPIATRRCRERATWQCRSALVNTRNIFIDTLQSIRRRRSVTDDALREVNGLVDLLVEQQRDITQEDDELVRLGYVRSPASSECLRGRWNLLFSTESSLQDLLTVGISFVLKPADDIFQTVEGFAQKDAPDAKPGFIENVINVRRLELRVGVDFWTEGDRRVHFIFRRTEIKWRGAKVALPLAIGRGYFDVLYLDAQLRVDYNEKEDWLNVYTYGGPVRKCAAETSAAQSA